VSDDPDGGGGGCDAIALLSWTLDGRLLGTRSRSQWAKHLEQVGIGSRERSESARLNLKQTKVQLLGSRLGSTVKFLIAAISSAVSQLSYAVFCRYVPISLKTADPPIKAWMTPTTDVPTRYRRSRPSCVGRKLHWIHGIEVVDQSLRILNRSLQQNRFLVPPGVTVLSRSKGRTDFGKYQMDDHASCKMLLSLNSLIKYLIIY
jgi:hypothetical protein